jgi:hypothetical protein
VPDDPVRQIDLLAKVNGRTAAPHELLERLAATPELELAERHAGLLLRARRLRVGNRLPGAHRRRRQEERAIPPGNHLPAGHDATIARKELALAKHEAKDHVLEDFPLVDRSILRSWSAFRAVLSPSTARFQAIAARPTRARNSSMSVSSVVNGRTSSASDSEILDRSRFRTTL